MAFNNRESGGMLETVIERLVSQLPMALVQKGEKYSFQPIVWNDVISKVLSFDSNILNKIDGPSETRKSEIYNSFVVKYKRSGLRGDFQGCIVRDHTSSYDCKVSADRYGKRSMQDFEAGDISNDDGANYVMNWLIETFSKMRVFVSYECTLDVIDVNILDTVRVIDRYEDWDTHFKVIGISRPLGHSIILDLVSVKDYTEVYGIV